MQRLAATMIRVSRLPPSDAESPTISPASPSPPPLLDEPNKNPWRISSSGGGAASDAVGSVTLMGEPPSSWPPLSSQRQRRNDSDSPPHPPSPPTAIGAEEPIAADLPSSSSSAELSSHEEAVPPSTEPPAIPAMTTTTPASPPPSPALVPPPSPGNAAATDSPRPSPSPPAPPYRRGRNQKFNHNRGGGGGGRYNRSYGNRSLAPGRRPNWNSDSLPQYPQWGFHPGPATGVAPPADVNHVFVPYTQPYNGLLYTDHGLEPYVAYYDHRAYEIPYSSSLNPGLPHPQAATDYSGVVTWEEQIDMVKDQLLFQIEYYFSDENLVKDAHLKRQMDSEGWVDIHEISSFRKVASLTEDINLIKDALRSSNVVQLQGNKMRKRHGWDKWILRPSHENSLATSMHSMRLGD